MISLLAIDWMSRGHLDLLAGKQPVVTQPSWGLAGKGCMVTPPSQLLAGKQPVVTEASFCLPARTGGGDGAGAERRGRKREGTRKPGEGAVDGRAQGGTHAAQGVVPMTANEVMLASSKDLSLASVEETTTAREGAGVEATEAMEATDVLRASFETMKPAMVALPEEKLTPVIVGVSGAITTVLGLLHRIESLREEAAKIPQCDATCIDRIADCTRALAYAHIGTIAPASVTKVDIVALGASGAEMREKLGADVTYFTRYGLIAAGRLDAIRNLKGYKNIAFDLLALVKILRESWASIEGKSPLTSAELTEAYGLAMQLLEAAGEKEHGASSSSEAGLMRQRAFTLFVKTYDEIRRIAVFLRWHEGDADEFAPSLYAGRRGKKADRGGKDETDEGTTPEGAPGAGAKPVAGSMEAPVVGGKSEPVVPYGQPGGSPFVR